MLYDAPGQAAGLEGTTGDNAGMSITATRTELADVIKSALDNQDLSYEQRQPGAFLVTLPGVAKLATQCWLVIGDHSLLVEAFVMRQPDENRAQLYEFLLRRNGRLYGVAFSIDENGDVYLVGRLPLETVTAQEIDRLLGSVLSYADENFNRMLEIGFASSIRREWAWRAKRGESLANLQAFARFADPTR